MLPGSSPERVDREAAKGKQSGRTQEIQRLIGRSLRAVCDMAVLGEMQIILDCDVLQADGGTRTASICGAYVALHDACTRLVQSKLVKAHPLTEACAAVSVGIVDAVALLDLDYAEDVQAEVDMNVVMTVERPLRRGPGHGRGPGLHPPPARRPARPGRARHRRHPRAPGRAARDPAAAPAVRAGSSSPPPTPTRPGRSLRSSTSVELAAPPARRPRRRGDRHDPGGERPPQGRGAGRGHRGGRRGRRHRPRGRRARRRAGRVLGPLRRRGRHLRRQRREARRGPWTGRPSVARPGSAPSPWSASPTAASSSPRASSTATSPRSRGAPPASATTRCSSPTTATAARSPR